MKRRITKVYLLLKSELSKYYDDLQPSKPIIPLIIPILLLICVVLGIISMLSGISYLSKIAIILLLIWQTLFIAHLSLSIFKSIMKKKKLKELLNK